MRTSDNDFFDSKTIHRFYTLCRRLYTRAFYPKQPLQFERDPDIAGERIYNLLQGDKPCMIARFGANELILVFNYLGITQHKGDVWGYITRKNGPWWWNKQILWQMANGAGFFPLTHEDLSSFCEIMLKDMEQVDVLGSWLREESTIQDRLSNPYKVALPCLEPWFEKNPWTRALEGKKVLVVHPFVEQIQQQYLKRELLFNNNLLPNFSSLMTVKAVQSYGGGGEKSCGFPSWEKALQHMKNQIDNHDYDIAILGCGAYGFPLAAHIKRSGKKAIHLGGVSQLLFGITGKRWLDPDHGVQRWGIPYNFYNE